MNIKAYMIELHIFRKVNNELEFLLLKRSDNEVFPGIWQMVSGGIEKGEKAFETAKRELFEETGLIPEKFWVVPQVNSFYSQKKDDICMVPVFAALVNHNGNVTISEEHQDYMWVNKDKAKELLAWPGQRKAVDTVYDYFTNEESFFAFVELNV